MRIACLVVLALACATGAAADEWRVDDAERVVAISDVHGAYEAMIATLQNVGIVDSDLAWAGGTAHLVIVGDILDRGPRSRNVMDLLIRLEGEAQAAGGYVHVLIGNHETMDMTGDMRYVSKAEYEAFAAEETPEQRERWFRAYLGRHTPPRDEPELREKFDAEFPAGYFALRRALSSEGRYGKWLLGKPVIAVINGTAFVHGGLSPLVTEYGLDGINGNLRSELVAYIEALWTLIDAEVILPTDDSYDYADIVTRYVPRPSDTSELLAAIDTVQELDRTSLITTSGPLWYRANVACGGVIERHRLDAALAAIGAERVVIGHTPTPTRQVLNRFEGRLVEIDTGMLKSYYHGSGNALVLFGDQVAVHNQSGEAPYAPLPHPRSVGIRPDDMGPEELASLLETGEIVSKTTDRETRRVTVEVNDGDKTVSALYTKRRSKGYFPDVAAYRLDRMLELDMVPVTVLRSVDGKEGTLQFFPAKTTSEEMRRKSGQGSSAQCPLQDQWEAMYVFDTLIYNEGRTEQRILYDTRRWSLVLLEHDDAFRASTGRPAQLANAPVNITAGWRAALEALSDEVLAAELGDVLDKRRLGMLAARRDELLGR